MENFLKFKLLSEADAYQLNPQSLAFVGDAVYTLYIRTKVMATSTAKSGSLHKLTVEKVKAAAQSETLKQIESILSDKEKDLVRRARNTKVNAPSKKASLAEYMASTALEALLGFLYISGQFTRLNEILNISEVNKC